MRTLLFISEHGSSKAIVERIQAGGQNVVIHIEDMTEGKLFIQDGFYNPETFKLMAKLSPDVVILDSNFEAAPLVRTEFEKSGVAVYGSSLLAKSVRTNPSHLMKVLNLNGIKTTKTSKAGVIPCVYSVVISGRKLLSSFLSFEYTKLMNDDIGPEAAMGSVNYHGDISKLDGKFKPLIEAIIASNFSGKLDFMIELGKEDLWCEGVQFYFKWNNLYSFLENISLTAGDFFYKCAMNETMELKPRSPWSVQVTVGVPPFPYPLAKSNKTEIEGINENNLKHTWLSDLRNGELFTVSSRGDYAREAKRRAYRTLANLSSPNMMYRTDIGNDTVDKCRELRSFGWLDITEDQLLEPFKKLSSQAV